MDSYLSSTQSIPDISNVPRHIAIIMDGNGRWAKAKMLPRIAGHKRGVDTVRNIVQACIERGVSYLTLFAFSSENWRRPADEVSFLMRLFMTALEREVNHLKKHGVRLRVIGNTSAFNTELQRMILASEQSTAQETKLTLTIAANYGGRWDIIQAMQKLIQQYPEVANQPDLINEEALQAHLTLSYAPEPDLFIRTGGEQRVSNFLLWQMAYTEFYFTPSFWPEFDADSLDQAILSYQSRERRFGRTSDQLKTQSSF